MTPTTPTAETLKYSTRVKRYGQVGMALRPSATESTAGVDSHVPFGGRKGHRAADPGTGTQAAGAGTQAAGTDARSAGTGGTHVLHRAQHGLSQNRLSLLARAGRYD